MRFPLSHACTGCGGSCHGVRVRVLPDEVAPLLAHAAELGVADPLDGDRLRFVDGHCALLDGDRCGLHARFGPAAKPAVCRQYPLVVLDAEDGPRVGLDPGCYTAASTRTAAPLATDGALPNRVPLDEPARRAEAGALARLSTAATVPDALAALGVAPGFERRWLTTVQAAPLAPLLARVDVGRAVRSALAEPLARAAAWTEPPPLALGPEEHAWAVDVARRMVALRLCATFPFPPGVAVLALGGALFAGWVDPSPAAFGARLAAWTRAMRAPPWWSALVPGPERLQALVSGG